MTRDENQERPKCSFCDAPADYEALKGSKINCCKRHLSVAAVKAAAEQD